MRPLLLITIFVASFNVVAKDRYFKLDYDAWTIMYNCSKRGYEWFHYKTVPDQGSLERDNTFNYEGRLPSECRQFSTSSYRLSKGASILYHRGHGVHQNIWDHDPNLMAQSNSMANIVPQAANLNSRGVWRYTEKLTECWRDEGTVEVWGGVIWGTNGNDDHFVESHGVVTPDYLWKVVHFPDGRVNAWLMPNDYSPKAEEADRYLVSPARLTGLTGVSFQIPDHLRIRAAETSVDMPAECSLK